ncbi:potassium transporter TrkA [Dactylosporangium sp. CA-092794]|uniref:potassium transporter TrkA n=1 Tax=Dactylosporangium sp. CA-092794 TaxID=3239929 RepID=UPI003D8FA1D4
MRLAVVGSGSLARATCLALSAVSTLDGYAAEVAVLARDRPAVTDLCHVAQLRAAAAGRSLRFVPVVTDPTDPAALVAVFAVFGPHGVLVCASTQSPWEPMDRPSAWTELLRAGGLVTALPLQAQIALATVRAVARTRPDAFVVNACLPDLVNPLLALAGAPVLTGAGNIGILATALQAALGLPDEGRLHVLAHHLHLRGPADPEDEALAWLDDLPVDGVADLLSAQRGADRRGTNDLTGALCARLLADLATGAARDTHLPGVGGRPGGYPVRIDGGSVTLRLPAGLDAAAAERANRAWSAREGVSFEPERVRFSAPVSTALAPVLPRYAEGFAAGDLDDVITALHAVRQRLRGSSKE